MKRTLSIIILLSLTLHAAGRIGILSYLYQSRHSIAYQIGLMAEVPIALCSGDYHASNDLVVQESSEDQSAPTLAQAHEIILFAQGHNVALNHDRILLTDSPITAVTENRYTTPALAIFHPPS